jgi:uncharacterized protein YjgD (DUF1641 family)
LFYLQHFALKTWFAESKMGISQNIQMQTNILELFLQTNQRQINEWDRELMSLHMKKKIIGDDVKRFETNFRTCATFIQNLKRESITKSIETQAIEEMLRNDNDSSQDWKSLLVSKQCKEPRILKLVEKSKSYKAVGLFRILEITRDPEVETKLFANQEVCEYLYDQAEGVSNEDIFGASLLQKGGAAQWKTVGEWLYCVQEKLDLFKYWPTESEQSMPDIYEQAIEESFEIARLSRSFLALSLDDEFEVQALPSQVQLLLIK